MERTLSLSSQLAASRRVTLGAKAVTRYKTAMNHYRFTGCKRFQRVERVSGFRFIDFTVRSRSTEDFEAWPPLMARGRDSSWCFAALPAGIAVPAVSASFTCNADSSSFSCSCFSSGPVFERFEQFTGKITFKLASYAVE